MFFDMSLSLLTVTLRGVSNKHCLLPLFSFLLVKSKICQKTCSYAMAGLNLQFIFTFVMLFYTRTNSFQLMRTRSAKQMKKLSNKRTDRFGSKVLY